MAPVTIPGDYQNDGPTPGALVVTFKAEEAANEGSLVTFGTDEPEVKMCDVGDQPIGWAQGTMVAGEYIDITLFAPIWKSDVDAASDAILYGGILSVADAGKVKASSGTAAEVVVGMAVRSAVASGQVMYIPITSTPDPITT